MNKNLLKWTVFATTALGLGVSAAPAMAQSDDSFNAADIVVTARRTEERLQDVPISITVFNQEQLADRNVSTFSDLAVYTPSLSVSPQFGDAAATFVIRGFFQESRTTAAVASYFADVVSPRGGPIVGSGDGSGYGNLFDLQNVQVLKGPQGTLFGRNTTGGAVLLVPQRPTDEFGGYAEFSVGNYDLERYQAVLNVPLGDAARLRLGMDRQQRDGYVTNRSNIGPGDFNDINYEAYRASFVIDLAPNLENYTIATYSHSLTNGNLSQQFACNNVPPPNGIGPLGCLHSGLTFTGSGSIPGSGGFNNQGFYDGYNAVVDPVNQSVQRNLINTTTWDVTDNLTIKNIVSYAELTGSTRGSVFGNHWEVGAPAPYLYTSQGIGHTDLESNNQQTFSDELQFQGRAFNDRLVWQAGAYYEQSRPQELTGSYSNFISSCFNTSGSDPTEWNCLAADPAGGTAVTVTAGTMAYLNRALYTQGTFSVTDRLKVTAGYRYTWDQTSATSNSGGFAYSPFGVFTTATCADGVTPSGSIDPARNPACTVRFTQNSSAPTYTVGVDYQLTDDDMLYAKYTRGYRQGSINPFGVPGYTSYNPERIDTYEIGSKSTFRGEFPGIFNVSLFYNDLTDMQLALSAFPISTVSFASTNVIINAGGATTYGAEIESSVELFEDFNVNFAYSYMNTNLDAAPITPPFSPTVGFNSSYQTGQRLKYTPENKFVLGATYRLPLSESIGDITLGATYAYLSEQDAVNPTPGHPQTRIDAYGLLNLNVGWDGVFGSPVDASLFVTNATDEEYTTWVHGVWGAGFESRNVGTPRMVGARLRYSFGGEAN